MNKFDAILWSTDKLEMGNIGARHYLKFSIHTPNKESIVDFYHEDYNFDKLLETAIKFININSKKSQIHKSLL